MHPWKLNYNVTIIRKGYVHLWSIFFLLHRSIIMDNRNKRVLEAKRSPKTIIPKDKEWLDVSGEKICVRFLIFECQRQEYEDNSVSSCYSDVNDTFFENLSNPIFRFIVTLALSIVTMYFIIISLFSYLYNCITYLYTLYIHDCKK